MLRKSLRPFRGIFIMSVYFGEKMCYYVPLYFGKCKWSVYFGSVRTNEYNTVIFKEVLRLKIAHTNYLSFISFVYFTELPQHRFFRQPHAKTGIPIESQVVLSKTTLSHRNLNSDWEGCKKCHASWQLLASRLEVRTWKMTERCLKK